jgi:hypothetical protein
MLNIGLNSTLVVFHKIIIEYLAQAKPIRAFRLLILGCIAPITLNYLAF